MNPVTFEYPTDTDEMISDLENTAEPVDPITNDLLIGEFVNTSDSEEQVEILKSGNTSDSVEQEKIFKSETAATLLKT